MKGAKFLSLLVPVFLISGISTSAQDWAQLNYYKNANEQLASVENTGNRVVFMGNSITEGWLAHYPEFFENESYVNRGIGGQTTPQMLLRFRQDVVALQPKVVVLLAGTNDIAGNTGPATTEVIIDNIKSMCEIAAVHGIEVVLATVLPASDYPWRPGCNPDTRIPELNARIESYAEVNNLIFLDYFSAMNNGKNGMNEALAYDGVHPNKEGYKVMAPLTRKAIDKALKK